jgi:DNA-binding ferritin-like protein
MLLKLAMMLRTLNLYSHHAHNMTKGQSFFSDHEFFGELYGFADTSYDSIIERHVGTGGSAINLVKLLKDSTETISVAGDDYFKGCLAMCEEITDEIDKTKGLSSGTMNLIQGISDQLEVFIYKIKRRI